MAASESQRQPDGRAKRPPQLAVFPTDLGRPAPRWMRAQAPGAPP